MLRTVFGALAVFLSITLSACGPARTPGPLETIHLVIDAGSSGTRFCLFSITMAGNSCKAKPLGADECIRVAAENGLADLPDTERARVIRAGFAAARNQIGAAPVRAALLGTGGFRKLPIARQHEARLKITNLLERELAGAVAHVISGEEEGRLAWHSVRLESGLSELAILETGGATLQLAGGGTNSFRSVSFPLGQNTAYEKAEQMPGFAACRPGPGKPHDSFEQCRKVLGGLLGPLAESAAAWKRPGPLFGLGSSWQALFALAKESRLDLTQIDRLGEDVCRLDLEKTVVLGVPRKFAPRTCFLLALQRETLRATGHSQIKATTESWPRGAAASGDYFPGCSK